MTEQELNKACDWLRNHLGTGNGTPYFIKSFREAMETCNPDKSLQELTWQDVKRIVKIADDIIDEDAPVFTSEETYYTEVLRRFKEGSK